MTLFIKKCVQKIASALELLLSICMAAIVIILLVKFVLETGQNLGGMQVEDISDSISYIMDLAIGIELVKMLSTHTPGTIIEVLLFAISREMVVEHTPALETLLGVGAIAVLFATRKYLFSSFRDQEHIFCNAHQKVHRINLVHQLRIPADDSAYLCDVIREMLRAHGQEVRIDARVQLGDCTIRIDRIENDSITRVEIFKTPSVFAE